MVKGVQFASFKLCSLGVEAEVGRADATVAAPIGFVISGMAPVESTLKKGQIELSNAVRSKYRLPGSDGFAMFPLELFAPHLFNRSGLFPAGSRVVSLLCEILLKGFNVREANHEGVVVQELPPEFHGIFLQKYGYPYLSYRDNAVEKTQSIASLRMAFSKNSVCVLGTLSHSTLIVGLLCLSKGAVWEIPEVFKGKGLEALQTGPGGAWDIEAVCNFSPGIAEILKNGISVEVLSWRIMLDEPRGTCAGISAAINESQSISMKTHEMEAFACVLSTVDELLNADSSKSSRRVVSLSDVQEKVKTWVPAFVTDIHFEDLFQFVIDTGCKTAPFWKLLLEYDRRYVNHRVRRISLQAFAVPNKLRVRTESYQRPVPVSRRQLGEIPSSLLRVS